MHGVPGDEGVPMTRGGMEPAGARGLARACDALEHGRAVVVPNPAPMAYGLVATTARAVNAVKLRPPDSNVAVSLHDPSQWREVASVVDLSPAVLDGVAALLRSRITVLLPVRARVRYPVWIEPAVRNGWLAAFNGHWAPTAQLWERFPRLYGSSANLTGERPAESAAQAAAVFGDSCLVVDADALVGRPGRRRASTMVRIDRAGRLELHRSGAHDAATGLTATEYVRRLAVTVGLPVDGDNAEPTGAGGDGESESRRR